MKNEYFVHPSLLETSTKELQYKYLGTIIDSKFKFEENITTLYKRANKRMYHLRQLHHLKVDRTIVKLFYMSIIESVIIFCICCGLEMVQNTLNVV